MTEDNSINGFLVAGDYFDASIRNWNVVVLTDAQRFITIISQILLLISTRTPTANQVENSLKIHRKLILKIHRKLTENSYENSLFIVVH